MKFKRFVKEYTLLKDRNMEEVEIYERYIPYAMVLNINKKYKHKLIEIFGRETYLTIRKNISESKDGMDWMLG